MTVSRELRERARMTRHYERKALQRLESGEANRITAHTLACLIEAGLVQRVNGTPSQVILTASGREIHDALKELGWFPPG